MVLEREVVLERQRITMRQATMDMMIMGKSKMPLETMGMMLFKFKEVH